MNQQKIGAFLKELRKEKGLTQDELGEKFYTTGRTVSRWETGSNMPDLSTLIELSEFYEVDIREIIDGERKNGELSNDTKETIQKVSEYTEEERKQLKAKLAKRVMLIAYTLVLIIIGKSLFSPPINGYLYGVLPEILCTILNFLTYEIGFITMLVCMLRAAELIGMLESNKNPIPSKRKKVLITIIIVSIVGIGMFDTQVGFLCNIIPNKICSILTYSFALIFGVILGFLSFDSTISPKSSEEENQSQDQ